MRQRSTSEPKQNDNCVNDCSYEFNSKRAISLLLLLSFYFASFQAGFDALLQQEAAAADPIIRAKDCFINLTSQPATLSGWRLSFLPLYGSSHTHIQQQLHSPGGQGARQKQRTRWVFRLSRWTSRGQSVPPCFLPASKMKMDTAARCSAASFPFTFHPCPLPSPSSPHLYPSLHEGFR